MSVLFLGTVMVTGLVNVPRKRNQGKAYEQPIWNDTQGWSLISILEYHCARRAVSVNCITIRSITCRSSIG